MADRTDLAQDSQSPETAQVAAPEAVPEPRPYRRGRRAALATGTVLAVALVGAWLARDRIAGHFIDSQLAGMNLPARYEIDSIAPGAAVLRHIVVGDPAHPDLVIERAEVRLVYGLGAPTIGGITLVRPRLYGTYLHGKLSFGALDKVLFAPSARPAPFRLPDYDLTLVDARGLLRSDYGRVGFQAQGGGRLRDGFAATMSAVAPGVKVGDCGMGRATALGRITIADELPRFAGPLLLADVQCAGVTLASGTMQLDMVADKDFNGLKTNAKLRAEHVRAGAAGSGAESLALDTALTWRDGALAGRVAANAGGVHARAGSVALLGIDGLVRARGGFKAMAFRGTFDGQGLRRGPALDAALASAEAGGKGSLVAPMVAQVRAALQREERGSHLAGDLGYSQSDGGWSVVVPAATLRGGSGQSLLALSRFELAGEGASSDGTTRTPRLAGSFSTGGAGLPRIAGRMERRAGGHALFRVTMAEYRAGGGALAIPEMLVAQVPDGSLGFSGMARLSGAIPGGSVTNLALPVQGAYSSGGELALYRRCISPTFDSLTLGQMTLDKRTLTLCPAGGQAIVRSGAGGLRIAAGVPALALTGRLGATPLQIDSGPVGFAWPGTLTAKAVGVTLGPVGTGPADTATRFRLNEVLARLGSDFSGTFAGVEARLAAVPIDVTNAAGQWRYAGQTLTLSGASFDVTDRQNPARFEKLASTGATLSLAGNRIEAEALLREPQSGRAVVRAVIRHDLGSGTGHADLGVDALTFDKEFQPDHLTRLALGVVANAAGTIKGTGRIDWTARGVTSTGHFGTDALDLAAAFGPVKGLSGALDFTDLLGLVTAPHQKLHVAAVNPGIEVTDGAIDIQLLPEQVLRLNGAIWPFLGGTIALEPTDLRLAIAEARHYTLTIVGLDAAQFLNRMQLGNLSATGTFDGQLPLVFDANGGRIEGGNLVSRPPGGNVSYIGALSYKDLSAMANFAFDALKSLDYKTMTIGMAGDLEGEVVTRVKFGGVKQGNGTAKNFITRQIANLPIQFNVNIRAPFYQLITSVKAMYDPAMVKDPRTLGLVDALGRPITRLTGAKPASLPTPATGVQSPDSGTMP